ncbi:MAG TPA: phosphoribosylglycinamide formyltransferase [Actinokineospora sp.]|nr:phosphoribosylglycinamide formyltransferase [Actinokineospora sp.]
MASRDRAAEQDRLRTAYAGRIPFRRAQESTLSFQFSPAVAARVVVLVSGSGTLLQALIDSGDVHIVAVGADRKNIEGLARAGRADIPSFAVRVGDHADRAAWDAALTDAVAAHEPDLVVSAGFMKILGPRFLDRFANRVVNTHPALLPSFPGAHAVADALAHGVRVTGSTVHLVDSGVDTGPIIAQEAVPVAAGDDEATLHERIKTVERLLLVDVVTRMARDGYTVDGRKVSIP